MYELPRFLHLQPGGGRHPLLPRPDSAAPPDERRPLFAYERARFERVAVQKAEDLDQHVLVVALVEKTDQRGAGRHAHILVLNAVLARPPIARQLDIDRREPL